MKNSGKHLSHSFPVKLKVHKKSASKKEIEKSASKINFQVIFNDTDMANILNNHFAGAVYSLAEVWFL